MVGRCGPATLLSLPAWVGPLKASLRAAQPAGGTHQILWTPRPGPGVGVLGQQPPRLVPVDNPELLSLSLTYISPLTRNPVLPREPSASVAGQKPGVLTFNRLDVAMFSTWTLARRGETWRRSGPGLLERPGFPAGPRRPRRGMRGTPEERRAVSAELVPGSRASSGFPATWSPRPAHARERMQTLEETRAANGGKGRGADLTGKR